MYRSQRSNSRKAERKEKGERNARFVLLRVRNYSDRLLYFYRVLTIIRVNYGGKRETRGKRDNQEKSAILGNGEGLKISCMYVSRAYTYHALR